MSVQSTYALAEKIGSDSLTVRKALSKAGIQPVRIVTTNTGYVRRMWGKNAAEYIQSWAEKKRQRNNVVVQPAPAVVSAKELPAVEATPFVPWTAELENRLQALDDRVSALVKLSEQILDALTAPEDDSV